jgi:putative tricarboxylic transport membrane protein
MMIHNIQPGPQVMTSNPVAVLGPDRVDVDRQRDAGDPEPAADRHVDQAADRALPLLYPAIVLFCCIGAYSTNNNTFDVWMVPFGVLGYIFIKLGMRAGPAAAGLRAGPDDGGEPAPGADHLARRLDRVLHPGAVGHAAGDRSVDCC